MQNTGVYWLRWLAVPFSGAVIAMLLMFPVHWLIMFLASFEEVGTLSPAFLVTILGPVRTEYLAQAFLVPYSEVYFAGRVAPRFKLHAAGLMLIAWAMLFGAGTMYNIIRQPIGGWDWLFLAVQTALALLAAIWALFNTYRREHERQLVED